MDKSIQRLRELQLKSDKIIDRENGDILKDAKEIFMGIYETLIILQQCKNRKDNDKVERENDR